MVKLKSSFICQKCGFSSPKWAGKCPDCESWNSLVEEESIGRRHSVVVSKAPEPLALNEIESISSERTQVGIAEFDRVLGGGIVRGSVILIGGDPGIGKSTISLQISHQLSQQGKKVLYVSGEESVYQTKLRADRIKANLSGSLFILQETDLDLILASIKKFMPDILIIDSIQVVYTSCLASAPGSVGQVRECAHLLTQLAKKSGIAVFLVGHVTKEGSLAGPKVLEHIVDTVLYFEGERFSNYRILRAIKNRFGSTNEVGVFQMDTKGLCEVSNPSEIFLAERPIQTAGSVVVPLLEGSRPILVEVQALVAHASYGVMRRRAQGIDGNRLSLLAAVLEKRMALKIFDKDIFVNVVGGIKVDDPAVDLGVCLAIGSAFNNKIIPSDTVVLGEVGLASEIRSVTNINSRIFEAKKLGFKRCILPQTNYRSCKDTDFGAIELLAVQDLSEAFKVLWGKSLK